MQVRVRSGLVTAGVIAAAIHGSASAAVVSALDNTANGTAALQGNLGSLTATNWNLKVFTVGSSNATISSMVMGMYASTASTYSITWELYAVDGSNNPTGSVLASDNQSQSFTTANASSYYTFTTGGTLASYSMQANQTYGLLFKSAGGTGTLSWTQTSPNQVYLPGSSGFSFVANRRTTNSGGLYTDNGYYNAWQMNVNAASAVPGAGLAGLAMVGLAGVSRRRRR